MIYRKHPIRSLWHRCLERQAFCTPRMYTLSPSKSIKGNNYGEFLKDKNVLLCTRLYKYAPNLESLLTQQYVRENKYDVDAAPSPFSIQSCHSCYATQHLCQCSFYKIFVKFRNSKQNVLKIVLIIVNINKDENKSLISNQFSLKNDFFPHFLENYLAEVKIKKLKTITNHF